MSKEGAKKRKRDGGADNVGVEGGGDADVVKIMAEMKAQLARMQNELDDTKGRLHHLEEVDRQSASMKNEMEEMKSRLSHVDHLERKCQFLESRCESLERSVQILTRETKWEYSAPSIPTSHWAERGFNVNYIDRMDEFLRSIKDYTCQLRNGTFVQENIYLWSGCLGANDSVQLHDDALLPHWQEFANALQLYQNHEAPNQLYIYNMQLTSSVINLLTPALKGRPIKGFSLGNNEFVDAREGVDFAIEIIQSNEKLKVFGLVNNSIDSMEDANHLVEAIISHPTIDKITLVNCLGGNVDAYNILCSLLSSTKDFESICLRSNNIRTRGSTELPGILATNPPLCRLFLEKNHLDDNDAVTIARALKQNTNLRRLHLRQNDITETGRVALRNTIYDSTSLNAVADSNHTCTILGIDLEGITLDNRDDLSKVNRGRKIYSLLSSRNREGANVQHLDSEFEDDSLKLVPKVLESVHGYSGYSSHPTGDVRPLSIMYEVLRSWKMPTLYETT